MGNHQTASREQLAAWFPEPRIARYLGHHTDTLYIWNTRITKAFLEDIRHVEVALRNLIDRSLVAERSVDWLYDPAFLNMNSHLKRSISKAQRRAGGETVHRHKILAELSFDTWRYLLTQRHQQKVWKHVRQNLPHYTVPP